MNNRIEKMEKDMQVLGDKIAVYQSKYDNLKKKKLELENQEIVGLVRSTDMSLSDISKLLQQAKAGQNTNGRPFFNGKGKQDNEKQ